MTKSSQIADMLLRSRAPATIWLIRLMVGAVFLSEGIQKFMFPGDPDRGAARFLKIGFPFPEFTSHFVASFEVSCGVLILAGLMTRAAAVPLTIVILVAIATTKIPILLSHGFWDMAHAARTDYTMLLGLIFILVSGAGPWSADALLHARFRRHEAGESPPRI